jgi:hypothetical protein
MIVQPNRHARRVASGRLSIVAVYQSRHPLFVMALGGRGVDQPRSAVPLSMAPGCGSAPPKPCDCSDLFLRSADLSAYQPTLSHDTVNTPTKSR